MHGLLFFTPEVSSMLFYITGALLVGGTALYAFLRDSSTPKTDWHSWLTVFVAAVFWPIVLPTMLYRRFRQSVSVS